MTDYLKKRPWIWIVILLGFFVILDAIFLWIAASTQGSDLKPTEPPAAEERAPDPAQPLSPGAPARSR